MFQENSFQPAKKQKLCDSTDDWKNPIVNINTETFTYQWVINNFNQLADYKVSQKIVSPYFYALNDKKCEWSLLLYPRGKNEFNKGYVAVYLFFVSAVGNLDEIEFLQIQFSIFNGCAEICQRIVSKETLKVGQCLGVSLIKTEFAMEKVYGIVMYNLTVLCKMTRKTGVMNPSTKLFQAPYKSLTIYKLPDTFKDLVYADVYGAVKLISRNQKFKVNLFFLFVQSPLFYLHLRRHIKSQGNEIDLSFIAPEVLQEILHFIYTNEAPKIEEMPHELLVAAENYGLERLKYKCELVLIRRLTIYNVIDTLVVAMHGNSRLLKSLVLTFSIRFMTEVARTKQFKAYCRARGCRLIKDVFWLLA